MGRVMTVRGEIEAAQLGVTLPHEHLLCDLRALWHPPGDDRLDLLAYVDKDPAPEDRGPLASDPYVCKPNLLLDDPDVAVRELGYFKDAGGGTVVELTTAGLSPRPETLRGISERAGVHVVAGCGWYRAVTQPPGLAELEEGELAARLLREVREGFEGRGGVRPGIIGEIGTGDPVHADELKALRAAARVQAETGLGLAVHLALWGRQGGMVLDELAAGGADLERVALCHLSEQPGAFDYQRALADRGVYVSFDTFGAEYSLDSIGRRLATDEERLEGAVRLVEAGYGRQVLVSQDVCERLQLRGYGGYGYAHVATTIRARLRRRGVAEELLDVVMRENPARLLAY
jgi:phosphotriesterase-related protein